MAIGDDIKKAGDNAEDLQSVLLDLDTTLKSLAVTFKEGFLTPQEKSINNAKILEKLQTQFNKGLSKAAEATKKTGDERKKLQEQIDKGAGSQAKAEQLINDVQNRRQQVLDDIESARAEGLAISEEDNEALLKSLDTEEGLLNIELDRIKAQEKSLNIISKIGKATSDLLDKIGLGALNKFFDMDAASKQSKADIENMVSTGSKTGDAFKKAKIQVGNMFDNLDKSALAAGALFAVASKLTSIFLDSDQKVTDLARDLSMSKDEAKALKTELTGTVGDFLGDLTKITFKEQMEGIKSLNTALGGTAIVFDKEVAEAAGELQGRLKLSAESTGELAKLAMATGKPVKNLSLNAAEQLRSAEKEFGIRLNLKNVLEDAGKITGQTRLNLDKFPGGLAKAVSVAKSLGVEMDAIAGAAGQLLDFQSSIEKEMEAELLLGRDLNLEAARQAALVGDQEGLMRELVREAGSLEELQNMNVIQQQALAAALGMSVDQLSDQVLNGEALAAQKDEELKKEEERNAAEIVRQEQALSLQEQQKIATENLGDQMAKLGNFLIIAAAAAAAMAIALSFGVATGPVIAGIAAAAVVAGTINAVADGVAPPGKGPFTITDKFGATTVTAAGDGIAVSPNIQTGNTGDDKAAKELMEMKNLLKTIANKPEPKLNMDSIQVGTVAGLSAFPIQ